MNLRFDQSLCLPDARIESMTSGHLTASKLTVSAFGSDAHTGEPVIGPLSDLPPTQLNFEWVLWRLVVTNVAPSQTSVVQLGPT